MECIIKTKHGTIKGIKEKGIMVFKGVPYAKPPVGELRWKEPQPIDDWDGIKDTLKFGNRCPQIDFTDADGEGSETYYYWREFYANPEFNPSKSEDCLYLNIYAPEKPGKYPVAFWIHGGAFDHGWGSEEEFDGTGYAERGVVYVSINYRVGAFGFLALPQIEETEPNHTCNLGTLDQFAAFNWVYDNIEAFGGDPDNITVFGQSAGAFSTEIFSLSSMVKDRVKRAILQSGGGYGTGVGVHNDKAAAIEIGKRFCEKAGTSDIEKLREIPQERIESIAGELINESEHLPFSPYVDGVILKAQLDQLVDNGEMKDMPYIIGSTGHDIGYDPSVPDEDNPMSKGVRALADRLIAKNISPVYVYFFNRMLPGDKRGAFHSSELWYTHGTLGRCWRPMEQHDYDLSNMMLDNWTDFIKGKTMQGWNNYESGDKFVHNYI